MAATIALFVLLKTSLPPSGFRREDPSVYLPAVLKSLLVCTNDGFQCSAFFVIGIVHVKQKQGTNTHSRSVL